MNLIHAADNLSIQFDAGQWQLVSNAAPERPLVTVTEAHGTLDYRSSFAQAIEIARSFDAHVYQHPWENDFSKHRNQSLSHAHGDWIFWIDADEVLEPGGGEIIREGVRNDGIDSLIVTMVCYFENRTRESWNNSIKLFKKDTDEVLSCKNLPLWL